MEDEDKNSKSLVLITRVGSTPTTGIKRKPSSLSGGLSFYLRRVSESNSTTLHSRGAISPAGCCSVRGRPPPPALQAARNRKILGCFSFYPLTSGPSSHGCLHRETADDVLEGVINAELKRASELSTDPKDTEGSGAFLLCKKEMFSWIACSNSSNRAQEKNAASVIARVQELVLFAIRSCVIAREHTDRQNKKVSPTVKMEDTDLLMLLFEFSYYFIMVISGIQ